MKMKIDFPNADEVFDTIFEQERDIVESFAIILFVNLIEATPVDTGTARASWDIAKSYSGLKTVEYGEHSYPVVPAIPKSDIIIVGSKNEYLTYLNEGWSLQAPSLFIEQAVEDSIKELL